MEPARSWTLAVRGDSMRALLKAGDLIRVRRAPLAELRAGDLAILLDWRVGPPEYVVHRLLGRIRRGGVLCAVTKGDANFLTDPLSPDASVVGVVDAVRAGGVWRSLGSDGRRGGLALAVLGTP
ncbi:MAG: S24/S26 family peptidase, partial [Elusimicrobiota bacterium]